MDERLDIYITWVLYEGRSNIRRSYFFLQLCDPNCAMTKYDKFFFHVSAVLHFIKNLLHWHLWARIISWFRFDQNLITIYQWWLTKYSHNIIGWGFVMFLSNNYNFLFFAHCLFLPLCANWEYYFDRNTQNIFMRIVVKPGIMCMGFDFSLCELKVLFKMKLLLSYVLSNSKKRLLLSSSCINF